MNPYEVLGVSETATDEQVRSAYIKLVKKYHPDRYQDSDLKDLANDKLKQVNEAYDTITNMRKKTAPLPKNTLFRQRIRRLFGQQLPHFLRRLFRKLRQWLFRQFFG